MSPFLFLLPLAPYPVLAYAAADGLPGLPLEGLLRTGKRLGPYPAALGLPFVAYWLLAPGLKA